jgi:hypothetical protein
VFSLGNKTYQHYQAMGRKLDKRFEELGAQCVFERGEGDDDGSCVFFVCSLFKERSLTCVTDVAWKTISCRGTCACGPRSALSLVSSSTNPDPAMLLSRAWPKIFDYCSRLLCC